VRYKKPITLLVILIALLATIASLTGILSSGGSGSYHYQSIRGETVKIYGKGLYRHMSAEVAPQGIAQDYVTLCLGIPLLIFAIIWARKGSLKGRLLLTGIVGYFLVTYLFYTVMGMYNLLFMAYVLLMGASFYAFMLLLFSFDRDEVKLSFRPANPVRWTGGFLIFISLSIAMLWLSIVIPPLIDGTVIPVQVEHYTTLIVQGLDLGILLPAGFISGTLFLKKQTIGYLLAPVYLVFLSLLMTALTAKVIAMYTLGYNVIPVILIIPSFNLFTLVAAYNILKAIKHEP